MTEENEGEKETGGRKDSSAAASGPSESGDPGRTPGSAEGERETIEEDLRDKVGEE
ncbi:MAG: hypothetical protein QOF02_2138 [Blastocatellia bacterium]|jgi:hypothetical protein|nr:hypothetical protein [Blastocatellia bacterium]